MMYYIISHVKWRDFFLNFRYVRIHNFVVKYLKNIFFIIFENVFIPKF